ncbi:MAG: ABC-ATPase domain-containing protein [Methanobacteriaceae archaeon]|nr:ABC-ATPase domain-containing protein [Methanobacteriaceae archaeon]
MKSTKVKDNKMKTKVQLEKILNQINKKGYKAYQQLKNTYQYPTYLLHLDHIQKDPYARPTKAHITIKQEIHQIPKEYYNTIPRKIALETIITQRFHQETLKHKYNFKSKITISHNNQEILLRNNININKETLTIYFNIGLPANGRRINGIEAQKLLNNILPDIIKNTCNYKKYDEKQLQKIITTNEDAEYIRNNLKQKKIVSFIADNSILPRKTGNNNKPLKTAKPFKTPETLKITYNTPNNNKITGMGIPEGITIIIGGGYHGKTTLLESIQNGVYNHIYQDGREYTITDNTATKIKAENGRNIEKVNINSFISNTPNNINTRQFTTNNASGSTSQATNLIEAIETGSKLLLIDEDTSATNFMIQDPLMQEIITTQKEPITPLTDQIENLKKQKISLIIVTGGTSQYLQYADTIIQMDNYEAIDITKKVRKILEDTPQKYSKSEKKLEYTIRKPRKGCLNSYKGRKKVTKSKELNTILFGTEIVDIRDIEQLVDFDQALTISIILDYITKCIDSKTSIKDIVNKVDQDIQNKGFNILSKTNHNLVYVRPVDIASVINRIRSLKIV